MFVKSVGISIERHF